MISRFHLFLIVFSACLFLPSSGSANPLIELDVDGIPGNGPDTIHVGVGETFDVGAWVYPDNNGLASAAVYLEDAEGTFLFEDIQFFPPEGWVSYLVYTDSVTVLFAVGTMPPLSCIFSPWRIAVLTFRSMVDEACGTLIVQEGVSSCIWCNIFDCEWVVPSIEPTICVGAPTSTAGSTWGRVKKLFR
ncbi:MAG: hypothetical protein ABIK65_13520 [Candidatus Eisenbacteria bacterium]